MSLDALLAKLEARTVTAVTDSRGDDVTLNIKQNQACTAVTPVTAAINDNADNYAYEERTAIMEFDGGMSRAEAEAQALASMGIIQQGGVLPC